MITVFLFVKGTGNSAIESLVAHAQVAASMDTLALLRQVPEIDQLVLATSSHELGEYAEALGARIDVDPSGQTFHFGQRLAALVSSARATHPLYIGGGSGVLMSASEWRRLAEATVSEPNAVIANNYYSCDFCSWSPGDALFRIEPPMLDNDLAFRLGERAGLAPRPLAKNAATQFDIDTPADLLILAAHPPEGEHLGAFLARAALDAARVERLRSLMRSRSATLFILGRVSAAMALYLERETPCQWRILSEERGMRASGREARGQVHSLLGALLDAVGPQELVAELGRLADGVILDTRVLFAHRHLFPSAADRFSSDLLQPDDISDPFVRELTAAVKAASIPILLGGHSVVSGGMFALNQE